MGKIKDSWDTANAMDRKKMAEAYLQAAAETDNEPTNLVLYDKYRFKWDKVKGIPHYLRTRFLRTALQQEIYCWEGTESDTEIRGAKHLGAIFGIVYEDEDDYPDWSLHHKNPLLLDPATIK